MQLLLNTCGHVLHGSSIASGLVSKRDAKIQVVRQSLLLDVQRYDHHRRRSTVDNIIRTSPSTATTLDNNRLISDKQLPSEILEAELGRCLTTNESNNVSTLAKYEARVRSSDVSRNCSQNWKSGKFHAALSAGVSIMPMLDSLANTIEISAPDRVLPTAPRLRNEHRATGDAHLTELEGSLPAASAAGSAYHAAAREHDADLVNSYSLGSSPTTGPPSTDLRTQQSNVTQGESETNTLPRQPLPWIESPAGLRRDSDTLPSLPASPNLVREKTPYALSSLTSQVESASQRDSKPLVPGHRLPTSVTVSDFSANITQPLTWSNPNLSLIHI